MTDSLETIVRTFRNNLASVREAIETALTRAGRSVDSVQLIAISKYAPASMVQLLVNAGATDLGENRPQSLWEKAAVIQSANSQPLHWHLVGHLQRNKVKRTLPLISTIQSLDSERLLDEIEREASAQNLTVKGFLEVNLTQDLSKTGLDADQARAIVDRHTHWPHLQLIGLMGMASLDSDESQARREFAAVRELRDELSNRSGLSLAKLSMGMSSDFEAAILEGSTHVRVGSLLFENLSW